MQLQQLMSLGLGMVMPPQFANQAVSSIQPQKSIARDTVTEGTRRSNSQYEESLLANAILNTEKANKETQKGK